MCHSERIAFFGELGESTEHNGEVYSLLFGSGKAGKRVAVLPDIYGLTDFYKSYASYLVGFGARVFLANPWNEFGELAESTRERAYERRHLLKDKAYCDQLESFLLREKVDAIVGFCIGGNFAFEMAQRGFAGTIIAIYPLPWGMDNKDAITPAFEYMPELSKDVTILMGEADHLAGPGNIVKMKDIVAGNAHLTMHLYERSNHGFFTDIEGDDAQLQQNARAGIETVNKTLFE